MNTLGMLGNTRFELWLMLVHMALIRMPLGYVRGVNDVAVCAEMKWTENQYT